MASRHVADLVEEQRAAIRLTKCARAVCAGAGERAFDMTEQLAFQQLGRNRRAIHGDERFGVPATVLMQSARHKLLARPGFAQDQNCRIAVCRHADGFLHAAHRLAGADQRSFHLFCGALLLERDRLSIRQHAGESDFSSSRPIGLVR